MDWQAISSSTVNELVGPVCARDIARAADDRVDPGPLIEPGFRSVANRRKRLLPSSIP